MSEGEMKALTQNQNRDELVNSKKDKTNAGAALKIRDAKNLFDQVVNKLELENILSKEIGQLSGGELQRFLIALTCVQKADIYLFDEPST